MGSSTRRSSRHGRPHVKKSRSPSASEPARTPAPRPGWCLFVGLGGVLAWLCGGLVLEAFHGFKVVAYLDDHVRRETWTLAHAHGTLLSLLCVVLWLLAPSLRLTPREAG